MLRPLRAAAGLAAASAAYALALRPWHLHWGATREESLGDLPGDHLVPDARDVATHAITIRASAVDVWPWLVQLGHDKGGFYSYTWLENLSGAILRRAGAVEGGIHMRNADRIRPEWQHAQIGDHVRFTEDPRNVMRIEMLTPLRAMVLLSEAPTEAGRELPPPIADALSPATRASWAFILREQDASTTRLVARIRGHRKPTAGAAVGQYLFWEPAHFLMERRMLKGIQQRAEARYRERLAATPLSPSMPAPVPEVGAPTGVP